MRRILLSVVFIFAGAGLLAAQNTPMDAYTHYTGDDGASGWSPGWLPGPGGGRWGTGYVQTGAVCVYYPDANGGRTVGMELQHYSSCSFPSNNSMALDTSDYIPTRWVIFGEDRDYDILFGYQTYEWYAESTCSVASPSNPMQADVVVMREFSGGC